MEEECNKIKKVLISNINLLNGAEALVKTTGDELSKWRNENIELEYRYLNNQIEKSDYIVKQVGIEEQIRVAKNENEFSKGMLSATMKEIEKLVNELKGCELKKLL